MIEIPPAFSVPLLKLLLAWCVLLLLYAETHYHFRFAPSLLYRRRPEIIADAPHRLEPGHALPILLIIKDAHRFPVAVQHVCAEIVCRPSTAQPQVVTQRNATLRFRLQDTREEIATPWWWRLYFVQLSAEFTGPLAVNVGVHYRCRGKDFYCWNDNHVGTSRAPLQVFRSLWPLPTMANYCHGDLHFHSEATSDQVEFGAPVEAMIAMAKAQGLSFCAVTDHSYDLDDEAGDYLRNDPALRKWHALRNHIQRLNGKHGDFVVIPGEEVSCGNASGRNVHFLILNHAHFIPGSGDSGERWLRTRPEHSVREILAMLEEEALAFAAHPAVPMPWLQKRLLRRDHWQPQDFEHARLNGMQFWNGGANGEEQGLRWWRKFLLEGKKLVAIAGNDAHGNFNRFRQISWPCLTMKENQHHVFGRSRTAVLLPAQLGLKNLLDALRRGRALITNGLMIDLEAVARDGEIFYPGDFAGKEIERVRLRASSSPEFGPLDRAAILRGNLQQKNEEIFYECKNFADAFHFEVELTWPAIPENYFIRAEATARQKLSSGMNGSSSCAMTNPIWSNRQE
ncbi:MAG: CehA/McbA family metallohydrolase [bacterium]